MASGSQESQKRKGPRAFTPEESLQWGWACSLWAAREAREMTRALLTPSQEARRQCCRSPK